MPAPILPRAYTGWQLQNSYASLPALFHRATLPTPVREPRLVLFNPLLARTLGLDPAPASQPDSAALFTGNRLPEGAKPLAQAYAGHQFGHFTILGDGRAILLGEQITPTGGRFDIQLKGPGPTPYSRSGDGRAALGPMLREYIISEAMHGLGIPTTRSLAVATTGESVTRQHRLPGAVLTRIAASHIRVGTFEFAAAHGDRADLQSLADYTIQRHDPQLAALENPYTAFLQAVMGRQAALIARWLHVGFIHGVMNTDNMSIAGETIDYGPCAFMDSYDPATVFSSIDHQGRYAYANQPHIAQWNLARFAETLLPLLHPDEDESLRLANAAIQGFPSQFETCYLDGMRKKLGLFNEEPGDSSLTADLLECLHLAEADFTNTFRHLSTAQSLPGTPPEAGPFYSWRERWNARRARQPQSIVESSQLMEASNPAIIPRNHQVELALAAATDHNDFGPTQQLLAALVDPFKVDSTHIPYQTLREPGACSYQTFCGT